jgi:signal transduction histidine kinase
VRIDRRDSETAPWAVVSVADKGVGVPAGDLPHVFERFHRGTNVGRIAGSGIGLAGTKVIVEQHGGTVDIESAEGLGTTITLELPIHPGPD